MDTFQYKALKNKKLVTGEVEGGSEDEASRKLGEKGYDILSIKPKFDKNQNKSNKPKRSFLARGQKIRKIDKVFFYKNFASMLKAGLPLPEMIDLLRGSIRNQKLTDILTQLKYDIESGKYISTSFAKHSEVFSTGEIAMIRAGEVGGSLSQSFMDIFEDAKTENRLHKDITSATMYPAIILSILSLVTLLLFIFVLPQLTSFFNQADIEVPTVTRITMNTSSFFKKYFIVIITTTVGLGISLRFLIKGSKRAKAIFDKAVLKIPMFGKQFKFFYIYKITRMLGLLIKNGVPILQALEIVEKSVPHIGYSQSIKIVGADVKRGCKLSESITKFKSLYPPFVSRMLTVGDRTGNTSESLRNISDYFKEELQETLSTLSTLIEPLLMVVLGFGVAFIAISVLIPLYGIVSGINQM